MAKTEFDLHSIFNTLLPIILFGNKGGSKDGKDSGSGLLSFLKHDDESFFEEALSTLDAKYPSKSEELEEKSDKNKILKWLQTLERSDEDNLIDIPATFRNIVSNHPDKEARVTILKSYADEESDDLRTKRFITVTLPEWITRVGGEKWKDVCKYLKEMDYKEVMKKIDSLKETFKDKVLPVIENEAAKTEVAVKSFMGARKTKRDGRSKCDSILNFWS